MDMITTIVRDGEKEKKLGGRQNRKRNDDSECDVGKELTVSLVQQ
jgi:hypothetical protein